MASYCAKVDGEWYVSAQRYNGTVLVTQDRNNAFVSPIPAQVTAHANGLPGAALYQMCPDGDNYIADIGG